MLRHTAFLFFVLACVSHAAQSPAQAPQSLRGAAALAVPSRGPAVSEPVPFDTLLQVSKFFKLQCFKSGQCKSPAICCCRAREEKALQSLKSVTRLALSGCNQIRVAGATCATSAMCGPARYSGRLSASGGEQCTTGCDAGSMAGFHRYQCADRLCCGHSPSAVL